MDTNICKYLNGIIRPKDLLSEIDGEKFYSRLALYIVMLISLLISLNGPVLYLLSERVTYWAICIVILMLFIFAVGAILIGYVTGKALNGVASLKNVIDAFMLPMLPQFIFTPFYLLRAGLVMESAGIDVPILDERMIFVVAIISVASFIPLGFQVYMFLVMVKYSQKFNTSKMVAFLALYGISGMFCIVVLTVLMALFLSSGRFAG